MIAEEGMVHASVNNTNETRRFTKSDMKVKERLLGERETNRSGDGGEQVVV